jgi:N6-adenosine-specific RNA methylase IME4
MSIEEIAELPVDQIASKDAVLLMWCTWGNLYNAMFLMDEWRFNYATGMPWLKTLRPLGQLHRRHIMAPIFGMGVWFQHCTELLLIGRRGRPFGKMGNPRPARKGIVISPRLEHSRKPEEVQLWVESAGFPKPLLEMFARRPRRNWTTWGDEVK